MKVWSIEEGDILKEIWKPIIGFEGMYEVSDRGNVRSVDRYVNAKLGSKAFIYGVEMKLQENYKGYLCVVLHKNGKPYSKMVHRLVANAFIPNFYGKPQVNHIDGNKKNNIVSNLEWCTNKENQEHAHKIGLYKPHTEKQNIASIKNLSIAVKNRKKPVVQMDAIGNEIALYESASEAARITRTCHSKIIACCKGYRKTSNGFKWKYKEIM